MGVALTIMCTSCAVPTSHRPVASSRMSVALLMPAMVLLALAPAQHAAASGPAGFGAAGHAANPTSIDQPVRAAAIPRPSGTRPAPQLVLQQQQQASTNAVYSVDGMPCPGNVIHLNASSTALNASAVVPDVDLGNVTLLLAPGTYVMYKPSALYWTQPICIIGKGSAPGDVVIKFSTVFIGRNGVPFQGLTTRSFLGLQMVTMSGRKTAPGVYVDSPGMLKAVDVVFQNCSSARWSGGAVFLGSPRASTMRRVQFLDNYCLEFGGALALLNSALEADEVRATAELGGGQRGKGCAVAEPGDGTCCLPSHLWAWGYQMLCTPVT